MAPGDEDQPAARSVGATPRQDRGPAAESVEAPRGAHPSPAPRTASSFTTALLWTLLGAVLPGLGFWPTRRRWTGATFFLLLAGALAGLTWYARGHLDVLAGIAVREQWLSVLMAVLPAVALLWALLVTANHLMARPRPVRVWHRVLGAPLVGLLCLAITAPLLVAANYARQQASLVAHLFQTDAERRSQTRPDLDGSFRGRERVNLLLLGGDNNAARDARNPGEGIRTDTTMLLSVDVATGNSVLVQLPRNLSGFDFPAGSPLAAAYPHGYWSGIEGDRENPEYELNSVWNNVPAAHPELFTDTDYPNADAVKHAVQGITGLEPDYFVLLNIDGIQKLIDAMGGVRVNVNQRIPMAQTAEEAAAGIPPKSGYLEPGPDKLLTGYQAMWYARSRSQSKDPDRMARQGCVVKAIVEQANPQNLATRYESIAGASANALVTDIPREMAPAVLGLGVRMKDARIKRVLFGYPTTKYLDGTRFEPWRPDTAKMQQMVRRAVVASTATPTPGPGRTASAAATARSGATTSSPTTPAATPSAAASGSPAAPSADLSDACAYHPEGAEG